MVIGADDNAIVGLSGGLQPTSGVRLVPPTGMVNTALTNPVEFVKLPGVLGHVVVRFWSDGATP